MVSLLFRSQAVECFREIVNSPIISVNVCHVSFHAYSADEVKITISSALSQESINALYDIANNRNLKVVKCPKDYWVIY